MEFLEFKQKKNPQKAHFDLNANFRSYIIELL